MAGGKHEIIVEVVDGGGISESNRKTSPSPKRSSSKTSPDKTNVTKTINVGQVVNIVRSPLWAGVSAMTKVIPWIGGAVIATQVAVQITTTSMDMMAKYTGDYSGKIGWDNFKLRADHVIKPFSYAMALANQSIMISNANKEIEQQNILLGNADVNSSSSKGV